MNESFLGGRQAPRPIHALTALRFFAAFLVVLFHHGQSALASLPGWCQSVVKAGYVGVPFFFVLSGFILAYNYLPAARVGQLEARRFWLARFARIYPVYAVALLVGAPLFLASLWQSSPGETATVWSRFGLQAVLSFGLVQAWIPQWAFAWNGPAWSLSAEAFFYLVFPVLAGRLSTRGRWVLFAGLLLGFGALFVVGRWSGFNIINTAQHALGWANPLLWLPLFLLGIALGDLHRTTTSEGISTTKRARAHLPRLRLALVTLAMVALILLVMTSRLQRGSQLVFCYAVGVPCAGLILLLANEANVIARLLNWRWLVVMGEASYSLYILHRPIHDWFRWAEKAWGWPTTATAPGFALYLSTCLVLSVVALRWLEFPCRDWIKRGIPRRTRASGARGRLPREPKPTFIR